MPSNENNVNQNTQQNSNLQGMSANYPVNPSNAENVAAKSSTRGVFKWFIVTGIIGFILSSLNSLIAVAYELREDSERSFLIHLPLFLLMLVFSVVLVFTRKISMVLLATRILIVCIVIELTAAMTGNGSTGLLTISMIPFILMGIRNLRESGVITKGFFFTAKPVR